MICRNKSLMAYPCIFYIRLLASKEPTLSSSASGGIFCFITETAGAAVTALVLCSLAVGIAALGLLGLLLLGSSLLGCQLSFPLLTL